LKNTAEINSDGINVYVTSTIQAHPAGKIILTILNLLVLSAYIYLLTTIEEKEAVQFFIPLILMFIVLIFFPWRYWFWNFYGKEQVIINTKTITYFNDYGIIITKAKTLEHDRLNTSYESVREFDGEDFGRLIFWSYDKETNLPKQIYQTSILISRKEIEEIVQNITAVYEKEFHESSLFSFFEN
jgi:hypothetical protein